MKYISSFLTALLFVGATAFGQSATIDKANSSIAWQGGNITGKLHNGAIALSSGKLKVTDGRITGGTFVIDMTSMTNADLPQGLGDQLMGHLMSADFFDVEKFPVATLEITSATAFKGGKATVSAVATIKGNTNPVEFEVVQKGKAYEAELVIDRAQYDVRYGSGSFFDNLGDNAILDEFALNVVISTL